jgi:hypothetical protein
MNRREFFSGSVLRRTDSEERTAPQELTAPNRNELFLLAMARGIDPATVDAERLPELLGLTAEATKTQDLERHGERTANGEILPDKRNELFLLAMAQGIDPATVDPERLPELLGLRQER